MQDNRAMLEVDLDSIIDRLLAGTCVVSSIQVG